MATCVAAQVFFGIHSMETALGRLSLNNDSIVDNEKGSDKHLSWAGVVSQQSSSSEPLLHAGIEPGLPTPTHSGQDKEQSSNGLTEYTEHARLRQLVLVHGSRDDHYLCGVRPEDREYRVKQHREAVEFRPDYLQTLSNGVFCMPIFFPSEESYETFHSVLQSAQETLDVCVFSITDNATSSVLIHAKERGVKVRIITDNDQLNGKGADVMRLHNEYNIPFKTDNSDQFMHNKFAVIDRKTVLTGSFNWSIGARFKNKENVLITNIASVVDAFHVEFEKLWKHI